MRETSPSLAEKTYGKYITPAKRTFIHFNEKGEEGEAKDLNTSR